MKLAGDGWGLMDELRMIKMDVFMIQYPIPRVYKPILMVKPMTMVYKP